MLLASFDFWLLCCLSHSVCWFRWFHGWLVFAQKEACVVREGQCSAGTQTTTVRSSIKSALLSFDNALNRARLHKYKDQAEKVVERETKVIHTLMKNGQKQKYVWFLRCAKWAVVADCLERCWRWKRRSISNLWSTRLRSNCWMSKIWLSYLDSPLLFILLRRSGEFHRVCRRSTKGVWCH